MTVDWNEAFPHFARNCVVSAKCTNIYGSAQTYGFYMGSNDSLFPDPFRSSLLVPKNSPTCATADNTSAQVGALLLLCFSGFVSLGVRRTRWQACFSR